MASGASLVLQEKERSGETRTTRNKTLIRLTRSLCGASCGNGELSLAAFPQTFAVLAGSGQIVLRLEPCYTPQVPKHDGWCVYYGQSGLGIVDQVALRDATTIAM